MSLSLPKTKPVKNCITCKYGINIFPTLVVCDRDEKATDSIRERIEDLKGEEDPENASFCPDWDCDKEVIEYLGLDREESDVVYLNESYRLRNEEWRIEVCEEYSEK